VLHEGGEDLLQPRGLTEIGDALAVEISEEWITGRRYLDMEELKEFGRRVEREEEEEEALRRHRPSQGGGFPHRSCLRYYRKRLCRNH